MFQYSEGGVVEVVELFLVGVKVAAAQLRMLLGLVRKADLIVGVRCFAVAWYSL